MRRAQPPLILGGGPAGAAAAIHLARAGYATTLIERTVGPHHKVCGDFITATAMRELDDLGVDHSLAVALSTLRFVHRGTTTKVQLPFPAFGLTRETLDEALLAAAVAAGAQVRRGDAIRTLRRTTDGFEIVTHQTTTANAVFLATGKHDVRGAPRSGRSSLVGRKTYLRLAPDQAAALAGTIELILLPHGYAGLQPVEGNRAVLCLLSGRGRGEDLFALAAASPHLAARLAGATLSLARPLAIAGMPYGHLQPMAPEGLFRLGDQAAVIPSFTGAGVALALCSARLAAEAWVSGAGSPVYARRLHAAIAAPMRRASLIHRLLLSPTLQPFAAAIARLCPAVLPLLARRTRLH